MSNARDIADAGHQLVAWVNFDPSSVSGSANTSAIKAAYNVSSIDDHPGQTGQYTINFKAGTLSDTNYSWVASAGLDNVAQQVWVSSPSSSGISSWKTSTAITLRAVYANNTTNIEPADFSVAIFR